MKLLLGTTFYSSLIFKKAPGTISSFVVFLFFILIDSVPIEYKVAIIIVLGISHYVCFPYFQSRYGTDDPPLYTLDEAFAMVLLCIPFDTEIEWISAFLIFRFFDILKPLGIKKIEQSKNLPPIVRNIADDFIAAVYTFVVIIGYEYVF